MKSEINWYSWDNEILKEIYRDYVNKVESDHNLDFIINVLAIYKSKEKNSETEYKIMSSKVAIFWNDRSTYFSPSGVQFYPYNISNSSILAFSPMYSALPQEFK